MSLVLKGIGTALPLYSITQQHAMELSRKVCHPTARQFEKLQNLYRRTKIEERASVLLEPKEAAETEQSFYLPSDEGTARGPTTAERMIRYVEEAAPLACRAAENAIQEAEIISSQISHLVTVSCTGFSAPGFDIRILKELKLSPSVARTHIGFMGCHGAMNGLRVASALTETSAEACVLLCAVELCTLHFSYEGDIDKVVANGLFADGAGAAVGVSEKARDSSHSWRVGATGSFLFPDSEEAMTWNIGNYGFEMTLSPRVPSLIAKFLRPWLEAWLAEKNLRMNEIRSWAIHPGGPRILKAVTSSLNLPAEATAVSEEILKRHGNMSSATLFFILSRLRALEAPRPCLALGFGPGLAAEAVLWV